MVTNTIRKSIEQALKGAFALTVHDIDIEIPSEEKFGDYSSNVALVLAKQLNNPPQKVAQLLVENIKDLGFSKIKIAPPGFINFFLDVNFLQQQVIEIINKGEKYGDPDNKLKIKNEKLKIQVEFISANPTGPLHVGNGRGGFGGDVLAKVLEKQGFDVQREYYINDRGVQVEKLAESVKFRYRELCGDSIVFPHDLYSGGYITDIARVIISQGLKSPDFKKIALNELMKMIKASIKRMGITFDRYFSEKSLYQEIDNSLENLAKRGLTYEKNGAVWFDSSKYGDDKDRVLIKSDKEMTYLVSDVAYHLDKFEERKFDKVILLWGADHHGYVKRFLAMVDALGHKGKADILIIQLLNVLEKGRELRMSKRAGRYITVDDVLDIIGLDAARFHFLMKPFDTPMVLDLSLAKQKSKSNPVYYVQYAHARMSSIIRNSKLKMQNEKLQFKIKNYSLLDKPEELRLIKKLIQYPDLLGDISKTYRVHLLPYYAIDLADLFHKFYEQCRVLSDNAELTQARLGLVYATKTVLKNTLEILGVSAPEKM